MIEILGSKQKINRIVPPGEVDINEEAYADSLLKEIQEDRTVEELRQNSINAMSSDLEKATATNLMNGADPEKTVPIFVKSMAAIEQFYKDKKSYEIANEAALEKSFEQHLIDNPQALLNYANNGELDLDLAYDSRIFNLQYKLSRQVDTDSFTYDLLTRLGSDIALEAVGRRMKKSKNPYIKAGGYLFASYGAGNAKDIVLLGGKTIAETGEYLREQYQNLLSMPLTDEQFAAESDTFISEFNKVPSPYRAEILDYILTEVSPYADAGGAGLSYGLRTGVGTYLNLLRVKNIAKFMGGKKKNSVNDGLMSEMDEITKERTTPSGPDMPDGTEFADNLSREEKDARLSTEIDLRKRSNVKAYSTEPVHVISPAEYVDAEIIEPSKVTPYTPRMLESPNVVDAEVLPSGLLKYKEPVSTMPLDEQLKLQFNTIVDEFDNWEMKRDNPRKFIRTADWESRRINYIDNNKGRGYTLEEANDLVTRFEDELASTYRRGNRAVLNKKKTSWGLEYEEMDWIDKGYNYEYQTVSAASPVPFGRAASTLETADKGATGAMYGSGPYASIHAEDPASLGHYKKNLDAKFFRDAVENAQQNMDDEFDSMLADITKRTNNNMLDIFTDADNYLHSIHEKVLNQSVGGYENFLPELKKAYKEYHKFNSANHSPVVQPHRFRITNLLIEKWLGSMVEKYKNGKQSVMNYWYGVVPESQPAHWVDQRDYKHIYHEQNADVKRNLNKYKQSLLDKMEQAGIRQGQEQDPDGVIKDQIWHTLFSSWTKRDLEWITEWENVKTFSDQYPIFTRLAMDEFDTIDWREVKNKMHEDLYSDDIDLLERLIAFAGEDLQRKMLVDCGIWGDIHSRSNVVFFKQTPAQMSNVYKQTWAEGEYINTKLLDSGAFPVYDANIQAFTVQVSVVVPGKGRKPVLLNKQKMKDWSK